MSAASSDDWTQLHLDRFKWACLDAAVDCENRARELREIAAKVAAPPPGTRVEYVSANCVRFVTEVAHAR